jgi:hypothetical protein
MTVEAIHQMLKKKSQEKGNKTKQKSVDKLVM